jgi:UDP-glucose 4-epimerase
MIIFGSSGFLGTELVAQTGELDLMVLQPSSGEVDLCDREQVVDYFLKYADKSTSIVLLANRMPYVSSVKDDFSVMFSNIEMAKNILLAVESVPVAEVIYTSSIDVYGNHDSVISESTSVHPQTNYAASKLSCETLMEVFLRGLSIPFANFRLPQVIGKGDPSNKVVNNFFDSMLNEETITIFGDGTSSRDFVSVNDIAKIINASIGREINTTLNLASGESMNMIELGDALKALHPQATINFQKGMSAETKFTFDNYKFKTYFPDFVFEERFEVLKKIYNYKREQLSYS